MIRATAIGLALSALLVADAGAFTIEGRVVNGTTGATDVNTTVTVVNPSGGMLQERTADVKDGRFTIADLKEDAPIYLLRIDYMGIPYNTPVQPAAGTVEATVTIYETTESWEGVHVSVPQITASRDGDQLTVERLFEVNNHTDPPRAISGSGLRVNIPADAQINQAYVSSFGVPVNRTPTPTETPGVYTIDYPIRPGETRIGISFSVPYTNESYVFAQTLQQNLDEMIFYGVDPDMLFTATGATFQMFDAAHGMSGYRAVDIAKGTEVKLTFTGGSGQSVLSGTGGSQPHGDVSVVPSEAEGMSLIVMIVMALALTALIGIAAGTRGPIEQASQINKWYETLLQRLAKLDDLRQAGLITSDIHRAKRTELKQQLATLRARMHETQANPPDAPSVDKRAQP